MGWLHGSEFSKVGSFLASAAPFNVGLIFSSHIESLRSLEAIRQFRTRKTGRALRFKPIKNIRATLFILAPI